MTGTPGDTTYQVWKSSSCVPVEKSVVPPARLFRVGFCLILSYWHGGLQSIYLLVVFPVLTLFPYQVLVLSKLSLT